MKNSTRESLQGYLTIRCKESYFQKTLIKKLLSRNYDGLCNNVKILDSKLKSNNYFSGFNIKQAAYLSIHHCIHSMSASKNRQRFLMKSFLFHFG